MKKLAKDLESFFEKYNFLWVLYFLFTLFVQLGTLIRILPLISHLTLFNIWDIIVAPLYVFALGAYVFKKKLFTPTIWKVIFGILLLDLLITLFRGLTGDSFVLPAQCQQGQAFCTFTFLSTFVTELGKVVPLYYALAKMSFPKFQFTFTKYPTLTIELNAKPNRFFAIPLIGFICKFIILIPIFIAISILSFVAIFLQLINAFVVLAKGKIWRPAYRFSLWIVKINITLSAYMFGLTDKYPSFGSKIEDEHIAFEYTKPDKSNRIFAIPFLGILFRYLLLLPFLSYIGVLGLASLLGIVIASFSVLFKGKYPESIHEFYTDTLRLNTSSQLYFYGMSDKYPSFAISLSHPIKKALLIGAVLLFQFLAGLGVANATKAFQGMNPAGVSSDSVFKQSFMASCDSSHKATAYCECVYNNLIAKYTTADIISMGTQLQKTQKMPQAMTDAITACKTSAPH